ncbi:hypothetical protein JCM17844_22080 [Iodidimonas gelatinilytica]|uniref:Cell division protein FtsL n=1 Tax=Iodidimonas gelatinilytica TaxID=1236966 RepID=A0A5A7MRJ4_9PROT|nr:hypothetical protein [Iodidimonas gelatinilytica]GEQ98571.1 hypothetical protein JCM17844_22080 [Iodidimonas gelatinilytica]GER01770.1 hypothetical protein JCM17845_23930 [Iodidimonas gelatinilytica]
MRQLLIALIALLAIGSAAGLYQLKHQVEARRDAVIALERQIVDDAEAVRVLEAEWAYLSSPQVIQDQAFRYLKLRPASPEQLVSSLAALPYRLEGRRLASAMPDDVFRVPSPRKKPTAPVRIEEHDQPVIAVSDARDYSAAPRVQQPRLTRTDRAKDNAPSRQTSRPTQLDFGARMQKALERIGDER